MTDKELLLLFLQSFAKPTSVWFEDPVEIVYEVGDGNKVFHALRPDPSLDFNLLVGVGADFVILRVEIDGESSEDYGINQMIRWEDFRFFDLRKRTLWIRDEMLAAIENGEKEDGDR